MRAEISHANSTSPRFSIPLIVFTLPNVIMRKTKILPKNYIAECVADFNSLALGLAASAPISSVSFSSIAYLLGKSTRFIIPNADDLLSSGSLPNLEDFDHLHLPYPFIAIGYDITCTNSLLTDPAQVDFSANKRIALAVEVDAVDPAEFPDLRLNTLTPGFIIFSLWYHQQTKQWVTCSSATFIQRDQFSDRPMASSDLISAQVYNNDTGACYDCDKTDILVNSFVVFPEMAATLIQHLGEEKYNITVTNDCQDEISVVLKFMAACQCQNITVEKLDKPKLAVSRKQKELAKVDYHILTIDHKKTKSLTKYQEHVDQEKRKSPRQHLRRGHPRRYKNGMRIWVKPQIVGSTQNGNLEKDYLWI